MRNGDLTRYLVGGLAVVAFICLTVWLIRSEGERTREAIREATKEAGGEVRKGVVEGAERAVEKVGEVPGQVIRDVKQETPERLSEAAEDTAEKLITLPGKVADRVEDTIIPACDSPEPTPDARQPEPGRSEGGVSAKPPLEPVPPEPAPSIPGSDRPGPGPGSQPPKPGPDEARVSPEPPLDQPPSQPAPSTETSEKERPRLADLVEEAVDLAHSASKTADEIGQEILRLSPEEEKKAGRDVNELVNRDCEILESPALTVRLQRLAQPLLALRDRKGIQYRFCVIDDSEVNAFAHIGGYIYVTQGLLTFVKSDAELQFVLGHEIAHVDLGHSRRQATYAVRAGELGGEAGMVIAQAAYLAIALGYSEEQEFEADEWAFRSISRIGGTPEAALAFLRRLKAHYEKEEEEEKPATESPEEPNADEVIIPAIEDHFRSNPPTEERIKRLESLRVEKAR